MIFTLQNITFLIAIVGAVFGVFLYFKNPQEKLQTEDAVLGLEIKNLNRNLEDKFSSLKESIELIKNNDLHELKGMFQMHVQNQNVSEREISAKLASLDTKIEFLLKK